MGFDGTTLKFDISELRDGINQASTLIKTNETEWRKYASTMNDWSNTAGGLTERNKSLNTQLEEQKKKVKNQSDIVEKYKEKFGEQSEQTQRQIQILNQYETAVNKTSNEIEKNKTKIEALNNAEKEAGKTTAELAKEEEALIAVRKNHQKAIEETEKKIDDLVNAEGDHASEIADLRKQLAEERKALKEAGGAVEDLSKKTDEAEDKTGKFSKALSGLSKSTKIGIGAMGALVGAVGSVTGAIMGVSESTREFRTNMAKVETAFTTGGFSAKDAEKTYKEFYSVLGDEGQATEAVSHLAMMANSQEDLSKWTNIATGVYATFGDSLPIEGLTEASNETAKTGQITGSLADALNWAGISEDAFQASLDKCNSEQERQKLITETLNGVYDEASQKYKEVNKDVLESNKAHAELNEVMGEVGAMAEPITTQLKTMGAEMLKAVLPVVQEWLPAIQANLPQIVTGIVAVGGAIAGFTGATLVAKGAIMAVSAVQKAWTTITTAMTLAQKALNLVLKANPIGLVITAVGLLVSGLVLLYNKSEKFRSFVDGLWAKVKEFGSNLANFATKTIPEFVSKIWNGLLALPGKMWDAFKKALNKVTEWGGKLKESAKEAGAKLISGFTSKVSNIAEDVKDVGTNIIKGVWNGINNAKEWLAEKIGAIFGKDGFIIKGIKKLLGINSPSKVAQEIGKNFMEGFAVGVDEEAESTTTFIRKAFKNFADTAQNTINNQLQKDYAGLEVIPQVDLSNIGSYADELQKVDAKINQIIADQDSLRGAISTAKDMGDTELEEQLQTFYDNSKKAMLELMDQKEALINPASLTSFARSFTGLTGTLQDALGTAIEGIVSGDNSTINSALENVSDFIVGGLQGYLSMALPGVGAWLAPAIGGLWKGIKSLFSKDKETTTTTQSQAVKSQESYGELLAKAQVEAYNNTLNKAKNNIANNLGENSTTGIKSLVDPASQVAQKVVNYTQNNYSPKALSAKEIYRNNNRAINMLQQGVRA